jgi:hypothetical protein
MKCFLDTVVCPSPVCSRKKGTCISGFMRLTSKWKHKKPRSTSSSQTQVVISNLSSPDNSHLCEDKNYNPMIQTQQRGQRRDEGDNTFLLLRNIHLDASRP